MNDNFHKYKVNIALGSNLGDRVMNITNALKHIKLLGDLIDTSFLYESKPMYELNQPRFVNAVCLLHTSLDPRMLLLELKRIEIVLGRVVSYANGPRVIDLDILTYDYFNNESIIISTNNLIVPHPRIQERSFVLLPLLDINPSLIHPIYQMTIEQLVADLNEDQITSISKVFPLGRCKDGEYKLTSLLDPLIAGILNVTPDSFSDGGLYISEQSAVKRAIEMIDEGADIIDIGGESTRPGSQIVSLDEELARVVPVIRNIRSVNNDVIISVDTRNSSVAAAAVVAGADMINDVSGGLHDSNMLLVADQLSVPIILMHMRGTPQTMTSPEFTTYSSNIVEEISSELDKQLQVASRLGIPRWMQYIDPGIGFAKTYEHNINLLTPASIQKFRRLLGDRPVMIGASRKRFISKVLSTTSNRPESEISVDSKDWATAGLACASVLGGAHILRVHNVKGIKAAITMFRMLVK